MCFFLLLDVEYSMLKSYLLLLLFSSFGSGLTFLGCFLKVLSNILGLSIVCRGSVKADFQKSCYLVVGG